MDTAWRRTPHVVTTSSPRVIGAEDSQNHVYNIDPPDMPVPRHVADRSVEMKPFSAPPTVSFSSRREHQAVSNITDAPKAAAPAFAYYETLDIKNIRAVSREHRIILPVNLSSNHNRATNLAAPHNSDDGKLLRNLADEVTDHIGQFRRQDAVRSTPAQPHCQPHCLWGRHCKITNCPKQHP